MLRMIRNYFPGRKSFHSAMMAKSKEFFGGERKFSQIGKLAHFVAVDEDGWKSYLPRFSVISPSKISLKVERDTADAIAALE